MKGSWPLEELSVGFTESLSDTFPSCLSTNSYDLFLVLFSPESCFLPSCPCRHVAESVAAASFALGGEALILDDISDSFPQFLDYFLFICCNILVLNGRSVSTETNTKFFQSKKLLYLALGLECLSLLGVLETTCLVPY